MAKGPKGEWVWMECTSCGSRNYRTPVSAKPGQGQVKLELSKYCPRERKHTTHKIRRK
ncbi:MAG: 50S ribosomal protein L33 [Phycisphaerae bacterium]|nr:50S ribosomal protein L33 [Phycisphaerae bacterium]